MSPADETPRREATCSCGQLRLLCVGAPVRVSVCHCGACKRRTGAPFGAQARFAADHVERRGDSRTWSRVGESGGRGTFHFCPICGATVFWEADAIPGFVSVAVGAFADPEFPPPTVSVYAELAHPWVTTTGIERHD
ncbi:MAG: GFA family protein [Nannocystaceae bacterium]